MHFPIEVALRHIISHLLFLSYLASYEVFNVHIYLRGMKMFGLVQEKYVLYTDLFLQQSFICLVIFFGRSCSSKFENVFGCLKQSVAICTENRFKMRSFKKQSMCGSVVMPNDSFRALWLMIITTIRGNPATTLTSPLLLPPFPLK